MISEADAVKDRYARRSEALSRRYSLLSPATWQAVQERQRAVLRLLVDLGFEDVARLKLIEVGAGSGTNLLELLRIGFLPENIRGVELIPERADLARRVLPKELEFTTGDASELTIEPDSMDMVFVSGVFSSLLDDEFQQKLAASMWRWVRPGGGVLWYDFAVDNPANRDVRGVPIRRVRQLFPEGSLQQHRRVTLAPPIARRVAAVHPALYTLFNCVPLLRTHRLCWIAKS